MWHNDVINIPPNTAVIGFIRDEANEFTPHRGPSPEVQPLAENLAATVE